MTNVLISAGDMTSKLCVRCRERPMAYPNSNNHWCKVCLEEVRKAHYDAVKVRSKTTRALPVKTTTHFS